MTGHEPFAEAAAACALDVLDGADREAFEAHRASCRRCQDELSELRRVSVAIGLAGDTEEPPAGLRDRTLRRATAQGQVPARPTRSSSASTLPWIVAAASVALAAAAGAWAVTLQRQLADARTAAADAAPRVQTLETRLLGLEQGVNRLQQVVNIVTAPDVRRARLAGSGEAAGASGLAYWSESLGLVFHATSLPSLGSERGYELWVTPSGRNASPVSLGMLAVSLDGTSSHAVALQDGIEVGTVTVTIEAPTGSPTRQPTGAAVLAGTLAG